MDTRTPRTHLAPHTPQTRPDPPIVTQRHHTEHSRTQAECLPPVVRHVDVLLHALRHLRFLLDHDAAARAVLNEYWRRHLVAFAPALAGMYEREQRPVAWDDK